MKRTKFSEGQIAYILRQVEEGTAVGDMCRKGGDHRGNGSTCGVAGQFG